MRSIFSQLCLTHCTSTDCSLPGSSVHRMFQVRGLQWVAISFSRGSSRPGDLFRVSHIAGRCFTLRATREAQIWPWSTEWSRSKANRVLPREWTGHNKHPLPTTQEKILHMDITRWSTPKLDWLYYLQPKMEKFYTICKNKTRTWLWLRSWTPYCQIQT